MDKNVSEKFPNLSVSLDEVEEPSKRSFRSLFRVLQQYRKHVLDVVNFNSIQKVSQAAQPTVTANRMVVWNDSDAATGQPTHYIVVNFGGTTVTFASVEVAP